MIPILPIAAAVGVALLMARSYKDEHKALPSSTADTHEPGKKPASTVGTVTVLAAQRLLNRIARAGLKEDGLYGPKTAAAFVRCAKAIKRPTGFAKVDAHHVRVAKATWQKLSAQKTAPGKTSVSPGGVTPTDVAAAQAAAASSPASTATIVQPVNKTNQVKPKPGEKTSVISVLTAQRTLNTLFSRAKQKADPSASDGRLKLDGKFGPKTATAWAKAAIAHKLSPTFAKVDAKRARAATATAARLDAERKKSPPAPAKQPSDPHPATPAPANLTPPKPKPGRTAVSVLDVQEALNRVVDAGLKPDGLYGPKTGAAFAAYAKSKKLDPAFGRIDPHHASTATKTYAQLIADDNSAIARAGLPAPAANPATPAPAAEHPPAGYDPVKAANAAPDLAKHLRQKGKAHYKHDALRVWQKRAGIKPDGFYGRGSAAALRHYVGARAPAAFYAQGTDSYPWGN